MSGLISGAHEFVHRQWRWSLGSACLLSSGILGPNELVLKAVVSSVAWAARRSLVKHRHSVCKSGYILQVVASVSILNSPQQLCCQLFILGA